VRVSISVTDYSWPSGTDQLEAETVRHKLDVLARHCADLGRPYEEISKTVSTRLAAGESARAFADRCAAFAELGLDHVIVITDGPWTADQLQTLTDAVALG
jgi:hypothetical protein